jgi:triphosphoribosyl-dephospho-CoA synthase
MRDRVRPGSAAEIAAAAQLACLLEASAPKPGNVSPGKHFADARYDDFLASAAAIGAPLARAAERPLGATIREAVEATSRWTSSNTNLGIVLLLAPLARAAILEGATPANHHAATAEPHAGLRQALRDVLGSSTVADARDVYAAIRLARPGGLGEATAQDVASEPTVSLVDVMALAADRDGIAREYATGFATTFESGVPALLQARQAGLSWDDAIVETFVTLLAMVPDSHIARRSGSARAEAVSDLARTALTAGGVRTADGRRALDQMDLALRDARNHSNPGTTADLVAATIFVVLLGGGWRQ